MIIKYLYPRFFDAFIARDGFLNVGDRHQAQAGRLDGRKILHDSLETGPGEHHADIELWASGGSCRIHRCLLLAVHALRWWSGEGSRVKKARDLPLNWIKPPEAN